MAVRSCNARPLAGLTTIAKTTLAALAVAAGTDTFRTTADAAEGWSGAPPQSVLVRPQAQAVSRSRSRAAQPGLEVPYDPANAGGASAGPGVPGGRVISDRAVGEGPSGGEQQLPPPFDPNAGDAGVVIGSPEGDSYASEGFQQYGQYGQYGPTPPVPPYASDAEGVLADNGHHSGVPVMTDHAACGVSGCRGDCETCRSGHCGHDASRFNADCEPPGLIQKFMEMCRLVDDKGLWTGRADALILWRNAPAAQPLFSYYENGPNALNAKQLDSLAAVGPRVSLFRRDAHNCNTWWEGTYIYSGSFVSNKQLPYSPGAYQIPSPGIFGNTPVQLDTAQARLVGSLQSAEANRRWALGSCTQILAGFRWIQWQENLAVSDAYQLADPQNAGADFYNTNCFNDLYGGQIGLDTLLWQPSNHFRIEGLVKAGAFYNTAKQSSSIVQQNAVAPYNNAVGVGESPATCSFAGELGLTGVVPLCCNWDFRFGYFGLWLSSIAQPTGQLTGQTLSALQPTIGTLSTSGSVVVQGLSLGLEGRW
jgi:hypothetical protein